MAVIGTMLKITFDKDPWKDFLPAVKSLGVQEPSTFYLLCEDDKALMENMETFSEWPVPVSMEVIYLEE
jgi:hypothetical protein